MNSNHNDLHEISKYFNQMFGTLTKAKIRIDGLFLNIDSDLECKELRNLCHTVRKLFQIFAIN